MSNRTQPSGAPAALTNGIIALAVIVLLAWRVGLAVLTPLTPADPVWYLSQTFSLLRGEWLTSTFGHSIFDPYLLPYMYGALTVPFFGIFGASALSLALWNTLLLAVIALLVIRLAQQAGVRSVTVRLVLLGFFLASVYMYGPRPEVLNIVLILLALVILPAAPGQRGQSVRLAAMGLLTACAGIVQPVGAVFALFFFGILMVQRRYPIAAIALYGGAAVICAALLYGPVILVDPAQWVEDFFVRFQDGDRRGSFDPLMLIKHTVFTPFVFIAYAVTLVQRRDWRVALRQILPLAGLIVVLLLFSRSYYLVYIPIYMLVVTLENAAAVRQTIQSNIVFAGIALAMPLLSHGLPTLQVLENPDYASKATEVAAAAGQFVRERQGDEGLIWVDPRIGMEAITAPNGRLYFAYIRRVFEPITLGPDDVLLMITPSDVDYAYTQLTHAPVDILVEEIVPPGARGILRFDTFSFERTPPLGLWTMRLRETG